MWNKLWCSLALLLMIQWAAVAGGETAWEVREKGSGENLQYFLVKGEDFIPIKEWNVRPTIKRVIQVQGSPVEIIIFHAVTSGTSQIFDEYQGAIYNPVIHKFYGAYVYDYLLRSKSQCSPEGPANCEEADRPIWEISPTAITIYQDARHSRKKVINISTP